MDLEEVEKGTQINTNIINSIRIKFIQNFT
jgi:hypothetical protein